MTTTIVPPYHADEAVLNFIHIMYNPQWDGSKWHTDPTDINVEGHGFLASGELSVSQAGVVVPYADLPQQAHTLLQALLVIMEQHLAEKYQP